MLQLLVGINVDWMRRRPIAYIVSGALMVISVISLIVHGGPRYGVDFTGGTLVELLVAPTISVESAREAVDAAGFTGSEIQKLDRAGQILVRVGPQVNRPNPSRSIADAIQARHSDARIEILRVESVGPRVGNELRGAAVKAMILALLLILIYVAIRYDWRYSLGAVAALFHDVFIALGAVSLTNREVTLTVVAAFLTIAGFSINDTIVVFDRIRERGKTLRRETPERIMNIAVNETLSRTIITSFTVFLTVMALFLLGGEVIHDFSFTMLVGVVFGTYSSVYVASALALDTQLYLERSARRPKK